jgi:predicted PurR-regulated permease PerM
MEWSPATKRIVGIACALIGLLVLYLGRSLIPLVILAGILAFLLDPIIGFLCRRVRLPRPLAAAVSYLLLLVGTLLVVLLGVPAVIRAVREVDVDVPGLIMRITMWLRDWLESIRYIRILEFNADLSPLVDPALESLHGVVPQQLIPSLERIVSSVPSALELATGFASTVVGTVLSAVLAFIFTLICSIYISLDLPRISQATLEMIPPRYRTEISQLSNMIREVWIAYLRGQILLCLIIGVAVGLGTAALGLPGAALFGVLAGILEVLPTIGPVAAAVPAIILALVQGSSVLSVSNLLFAALVATFYWVIQQLENNLVVPRVIGNAIKVHPMLVMAAVVIGASLGGIFGAIIASPVLATGRVLAHYVYCRMVGLSPFPAVLPPVVPAQEEPSVFELAQTQLSRLRGGSARVVAWSRAVLWPILRRLGASLARAAARLFVSVSRFARWLRASLPRAVARMRARLSRVVPRLRSTALRATAPPTSGGTAGAESVGDRKTPGKTIGGNGTT